MTDTLIYTDEMIEDFETPLLQKAFRLYFEELGMHIRNWEALFREMNEGGENRAILRTDAQGEIVGFIQFAPMRFSSWFFEEESGFIREFWVAPAWRRQGQGTLLLARAEEWFKERGIEEIYLTSDDAGAFYEARGYVRSHACTAKNRDNVYRKHLNIVGQGLLAEQ